MAQNALARVFCVRRTSLINGINAARKLLALALAVARGDASNRTDISRLGPVVPIAFYAFCAARKLGDRQSSPRCSAKSASGFRRSAGSASRPPQSLFQTIDHRFREIAVGSRRYPVATLNRRTKMPMLILRRMRLEEVKRRRSIIKNETFMRRDENVPFVRSRPLLGRYVALLSFSLLFLFLFLPPPPAPINHFCTLSPHFVVARPVRVANSLPPPCTGGDVTVSRFCNAATPPPVLRVLA
jgi:hypothetical protein